MEITLQYGWENGKNNSHKIRNIITSFFLKIESIPQPKKTIKQAQIDFILLLVGLSQKFGDLDRRIIFVLRHFHSFYYIKRYS